MSDTKYSRIPTVSETRHPFHTPGDSSEGEWSDDSSCSSYYSDSDSSAPEWWSLVDARGELFYIDCHAVVAQNVKTDEIKRNEFDVRSSTRRSTRVGKFARLLRRRESKRRSKRATTNVETLSASTDTAANKVTFRDCQEGEVREVILTVDPQNRHKLGRRATLVEALLGLSISTFADGSRIMIAGFIPDGEAIKHRIKIGDWLKSINDTTVNFDNINLILESIKIQCEVRLKLQRIAGVEVTTEPPINELSNQSELVRQLTMPDDEKDQILAEILSEIPVGVLYLATEGLTETGPEYESVIYCYPQPMKKNTFCNVRGTFLTLNHLLLDILKARPTTVSFLKDGNLVHVVCTYESDKLFILAVPEVRCNRWEAIKAHAELIRMLKFCYQTLDKTFIENNYQQLNRFFSKFFARIVSSGLWPGAPQSVILEELTAKAKQKTSPQFESVLGAAHWIPLPKIVQMQIDDALNEMEATDYRDWYEDPDECQRLYTVLGSAFYHKGYLLATHLPWDDLIDVHSFCRQQGLLHLSRTEPVRSLILWREVFPQSWNRGIPDDTIPYKIPQGRWFLLIVGSGHDFLAVLLEAGGCTMPAKDIPRPDVFYVEEIQETFQHIQNMGVSVIAEKWLAMNKRPEVATPDSVINRNQKRGDFLSTIGFMKSHSPTQSKQSTSPQQKKPEVTSILKRRSPDRSQASFSGSGSAFSFDDVSEDSTSQGGYSERSEISDEPVVGRRATRERDMNSDDSDIDWESYRGDSHTSSTYDLSDLRQSLLSDTNEVTASKLTTGSENVLFHYVQFDEMEGILLCPSYGGRNSSSLDSVITNFRKSCQSIQKVLQNTVRFKEMLNQDMTKSVINKSLIAIKEHGVLFECSIPDEIGKKPYILTYWVVGRLFYNPHPRELYVCYQDTVPQNLIEVAFRLCLSTAG